MNPETKFLILDTFKLLGILILSCCFLILKSVAFSLGTLCVCALIITSMYTRYKKRGLSTQKQRLRGALVIDSYLTIAVFLVTFGLGLGMCQQYPLAERFYLVGSQMMLRLNPEITVCSVLLPTKKTEKIASTTLLAIYGENSIQYRHYLKNLQER